MLVTGAYAQTSTITKISDVKITNSRTFVASAYCLRGKMANGQHVHNGAIAADPRVLPIGSIVFIEGMGTYTVKDTGGAIKGNRIDIWMPGRGQAMKFGKRKVQLKVVSTPPRKVRV